MIKNTAVLSAQKRQTISDIFSSLYENLDSSSTGIPSTWDRLHLEPATSLTYPFEVFSPSYQVIYQLSQELRILLDEIKELRSDLQSKPLSSSVLLSSINDKNLIIQHPISIIVEEYEEECLARWPEVNAYGIGPTLHETLIDLKHNIVNLFYDLTKRDRETLGDLALETLNTLNAYIEREV